MTRRTLLAGSLTLPSLAQPRALTRPAALKPGDTVGLITPATYVSNPDSLELAIRTAKHFQLVPKLGKNVAKRAGYLGGSIDERLDDLHAMFRDRDVKAVFCIRGGYGSGQLLDRIDYDLIRRNPKVFVGYSDITALHAAIHQKCGLVTFHGPVALSRFNSYTQEHFRKVLFEAKPAGVLTNPPERDSLRPDHLLRAIRPGTARGPLVGGNLSLVVALMGTPYELDTRGKILFLEDVGEAPYRIDRMLTHLRLAGKLQQAAGIIWGECNDCRPSEYKPGFESTFATPEVADQIFGPLNIPVLSGLTIGHTDDQLTLPFGITATLDAAQGTVTLEEPAVG